MNERTLAIIKPDSFSAQLAGAIMNMIYSAGMNIVGMKLIHMSKQEAEGFYSVHQGKVFFDDLTSFMSEGPVFVMVLEGENIINHWRELMGPTNPHDAPTESVRGKYGTDIGRNAVHGSDAPETAVQEIAYFFNAFEIVQRP